MSYTCPLFKSSLEWAHVLDTSVYVNPLPRNSIWMDLDLDGSCGAPDFDDIAEAADAVCELVSGAGRIAADEVVGAEVLVAGAIAEHVINGGQDRGGDRDRRLFRATASLEAQELSFEVAALLPRRRPGALHQHGLEPGRSLGHPGRAALAGALVETGNQTRPGQKMPGGREPAHVKADLGNHDLGRCRAQPRHLGQALDGVAKGRKCGLDARIECRQRLLQLPDRLQMLIKQKAVMVPDMAVESLDQGLSRAAQTAAAEF